MEVGAVVGVSFFGLIVLVAVIVVAAVSGAVSSFESRPEEE